MLALLGAIVAGMLTTLAPCVLPLLPVIVGGSMSPSNDRLAGWRRALVVTAALGASIVVFTLALEASTAFLDVPPGVWPALSGGLLIVLGLIGVFPTAWDAAAGRLGLQRRSTGRLVHARRRSGVAGAGLTGVALGPVFSSCSPLYGYVVVTVLPATLGYGLVLLGGYVVGLCATLMAIALAGQRLIGRLGWAADAHGRFRRILGVVFVLVGLAVLLGWDRQAQTWIIDHTPIAPWELDRRFVPAP